ncbi:3-deoxy-D-manno-octulosonic acid transferase [Roseovarius autotrophicus]|uniref:3-deoxy-D-manno-octulosonic acid transferase n=1 Tax=Roseovarius autotrophicus TaxID=2824121 RepID=UPI0019ECF343|nr:glycosyltransferase N-terminal domain-containing protein [Roseovarius autotrophicus]MBE0454639.1 3-deoxy-D-manno-octulosonic acid transferase [Roseovarius sp.]
MSRSLGLAAYLAIARRGGARGTAPDRPRPDGSVIWAHAADAGRADVLAHLAERLAQHRPGVHMVLTSPEGPPRSLRENGRVIWQAMPPDTLAAAETFLGHWRPGLGIWTGGDLKPALLVCAARAGVPLYLVDAEAALLERSHWRWFPDLARAVLTECVEIHTRDDAAARQARRLGAPPQRVKVTGILRAGALSLPYNLKDREELAQILRGRPLWLAAMVQREELETVLVAHREVSRIAHRALLIVVPDEVEDSAAMARDIDAGGWRQIAWSSGALPDEATQVILADTRGEMGLWYRLAPVTFMGSSLVSGQHGRDPNEPAAHGSAILYGPNVARYLTRYSRYAEAGAARIVRDTATLAAAVQGLLPPDRAAAMAHAAWDVASRGAEVMDRVVDMVLDRLDREEAAR